MLLRLIQTKPIHGKLRGPGYEFEFPHHAALALIANGDAVAIEQYTRSVEATSLEALAQLDVQVKALSHAVDDLVTASLTEPVLHDPLPPLDDEPTPQAPADAPDEDEDAPDDAPADEGDDASRIRAALDGGDYQAMIAIAKEYNLTPPEGRTNWRKSEVLEALTELLEAAQ